MRARASKVLANVYTALAPVPRKAWAALVALIFTACFGQVLTAWSKDLYENWKNVAPRPEIQRVAEKAQTPTYTKADFKLMISNDDIWRRVARNAEVIITAPPGCVLGPGKEEASPDWLESGITGSKLPAEPFDRDKWDIAFLGHGDRVVIAYSVACIAPTNVTPVVDIHKIPPPPQTRMVSNSNDLSQDGLPVVHMAHFMNETGIQAAHVVRSGYFRSYSSGPRPSFAVSSNGDDTARVTGSRCSPAWGSEDVDPPPNDVGLEDSNVSEQDRPSGLDREAPEDTMKQIVSWHLVNAETRNTASDQASGDSTVSSGLSNAPSVKPVASTAADTLAAPNPRSGASPISGIKFAQAIQLVGGRGFSQMLINYILGTPADVQVVDSGHSSPENTRSFSGAVAAQGNVGSWTPAPGAAALLAVARNSDLQGSTQQRNPAQAASGQRDNPRSSIASAPPVVSHVNAISSANLLDGERNTIRGEQDTGRAITPGTGFIQSIDRISPPAPGGGARVTMLNDGGANLTITASSSPEEVPMKPKEVVLPDFRSSRGVIVSLLNDGGTKLRLRIY
jgi:hypothetical protein